MTSPTAAMLVRAGFVVVRVPVNVSRFRSILALGWHGCTFSSWPLTDGHVLTTGMEGMWVTLLEHRRAAANYHIHSRRSSPDIRVAAGEEAFRARVAAQSAYYELSLTTDDPKTIQFASLCIEAVGNIDKSKSKEIVDDNHEKTRLYLADMIAAAREAQPGALERLGELDSTATRT